jgi:hypothetical protein
LGTTVINQNLIHEGIKRSLKSGNTCYHSVQNLLSSRLLSKNIDLNTQTIIFPVGLNDCVTCSLILRDENRLKLFENRMLRRKFGTKGDETVGGWRKLHKEELHSLYS